MNTTNLKHFFNQRVYLAQKIIADFGSYFEADAEIIVCCAFGALASKLWPGTKIDRQRFIQLLVEFSPPNANLSLISTPILSWQLENMGKSSAAIRLATRFFPGHPTETLDPKKVDQDETTIIEFLRDIDLKTIRNASYASIIYTYLRCGLIHKYDVDCPITPINLVEESTTPTYVNTQYQDGHRQRLLHIPFDYLVRILTSSTQSLFSFWENSSDWNKPQPEIWWVNG